MKKIQRAVLLAGLVFASFAGTTAYGQITILSDTYNITNNGSGFALDEGVNSAINPPITNRMTGTVAPNLRYMRTAGARANSAYTIGSNRLRVGTEAGSTIGRFSLSANGVSMYNFASALGTSGATPADPAVYELRISMRNDATSTARFSFALATGEADANNWDFGVQLYRTNTTADHYMIQKRVNTGSSGVANMNEVMAITEPGTVNTLHAIRIRVTDAGAESGENYNSRVQVSLDNGATWIYDTSTDPGLPNGWRLDGPGRFILFDQAGNNSGAVFYDNFSVVSFYAPPPPPDKVWTGAGGDDNWSTAANWNGAAPVGDEPLVFGAASRQGSFNDIASLTVPRLTFTNGGFSLDGNSLGIGEAVMNLAGDNNIILPLDWYASGSKTWHVETNSVLTLSGITTVNTGGEHSVLGGGTLRITGALDINLTPIFVVHAGQVLLDGGTFNSLGGFRIGSAPSASAPVQTVVSNGATLTLEVPSANLRVGDANNTTGRLIINNGTVTMFGGALGIPYAAGSTGEVFQAGGVVRDCYVAFSDNGAGTGLYEITNGVLEPLQIRKDTAAGSAIIRFQNCLLRPALGANSADFMSGLDEAEIQAGGLTIDATSEVTIAQALSGAGGLTKVNYSTVTLSGENTYAGNTVVQEGKLVLPTTQTNGASVQVATGAELGVARAENGTSLTAGSLNLGNCTLSFDLGLLGNPTAPLVQVATLSASGGPGSVMINVSGGLGLSVGQFALIDYNALSGGFTSFTLGTLPPGVSATLVNNTANSSIDLQITSAPGLRWTGANGTAWDFSTANWFDDGTGASGFYNDGYPTRFVDGAVTGNVELMSTFFPASLLISNNTLAYVFSGGGIYIPKLTKEGTNSLTRVGGGADLIDVLELNAGTYVASDNFDAGFSATLVGAGTFVKTGTGTLTVSANNSDFDGAFVIQQGMVRPSTAGSLGSTNGSTTIASGATLDLNDLIFPHEPVFVAGSGVNDQGAIIDSTTLTAVAHNLTDVTMTGHTTLGSPNGGRWDIRIRSGSGPGPGLRGNGFNLTKVGPGMVSIASQRNLGAAAVYWEMNLGNILIDQGTLAFAEALDLGNPGASLTVNPGAVLQFFDLGATNPIQRVITLNDARINGDGGANGVNVLNGGVQLSGANIININQATTIVNGVMSGSGSLTVTLSGSPATGTLLLNGINTYTGDTTVTSGTVGGNGSLAGNLIMSGGTLSPGAGLGVFTVNGNLTLDASAATLMEIDRAQTPNSDRLVVNGGLAFGGALTVVLPAEAAAPQAGDVYQLFSKGGSGTFASVTLPNISALPGNLSWNTDELLTHGRISVDGTAQPPAISAPYVSGGNLVLTGTGPAGQSYSVLTSTDVAAPVATWTTNATGSFGGDGAFSNAIPVNLGEPRRFFLIKQP